MEGPYPANESQKALGLKGKQEGSGTGDIPRNALDTGKFGHSISGITKGL